MRSSRQSRVRSERDENPLGNRTKNQTAALGRIKIGRKLTAGMKMLAVFLFRFTADLLCKSREYGIVRAGAVMRGDIALVLGEVLVAL